MTDLNKNASIETADTRSSDCSLNKEKSKEEFRQYLENTSVSKFYFDNHVNQTFDSVMEKKKTFLENRKLKFTVMECIEKCNELIDESDPDNSRPQIVHLIQTGNMAKKLYPELRWMHLIGFLHDLGKVLLHKDLFSEPQWCVVGDTFPVGCAFEDSNVYPKYFEKNPDWVNPKYNTKYGIYEPNCGFDNVHFSWSHDEYLYQILKDTKLPEEGLYMIRYHSFYPWHSNNGYSHLASQKDHEFLKYLKMFQKCDLYSKIDEEFNLEAELVYYRELIKEYIPNDNELLW